MCLLIPGAEVIGGDVSRGGQFRDQDGLSWLPADPGGFLSDPRLESLKVWLLRGLWLWGFLLEICFSHFLVLVIIIRLIL